MTNFPLSKMSKLIEIYKESIAETGQKMCVETFVKFLLAHDILNPESALFLIAKNATKGEQRNE